MIPLDRGVDGQRQADRIDSGTELGYLGWGRYAKLLDGDFQCLAML